MTFTKKSCLEKQQDILQLLLPSDFSRDTLYDSLIRLGKRPTSFDVGKRLSPYLVAGCQSDLYLYEQYREGCLYFFFHSDSLISAGITFLFTHVYSGEAPEIILTTPPTFFEPLKKHLSIGRVQGGEAVFLRIKQLSVHYL